MLFFPALVLLAGGRQGEAVSIVVHADRPAHAISRDLFGVFFEEINHSGDGGLNPELIRNFNFREPLKDNDLPGWTLLGNGSIGTVLSGRGEIDLQRSTAGDALVGASNAGYWGIPLFAGAKYRFAITCQSDAGTPLALRLVDTSGHVCGTATVVPSAESGLVKGTITPSRAVRAAHLEIGLTTAGSARIKSVSLQPAATWKGHGLRPDLASLVDGLQPAFVRFPGGCYVEGGDYLADRFKWETTLVEPAKRPGHLNETWGYWSSDALGYFEYLQWCEDMGAQALFVVNCGFSHKETVPVDKLDAYLINTLDSLEYALGPSTSPLGALRARRGHPAPFPLKYVEIGNENGQGWPTGGSPADYAAHYKIFADAIKAKYPELTLIADTRRAANAEVVDDHYYNSPSWFWRNSGIYDQAPRTGPKVYVGEYAVTSNCGKGNLRAALGEAAFMTGLERNSDLVRMASYAPLFVNANNRAWNPDAICFDGETSYGTPSYYVQSLFGANRGDTLLPSDSPSLVSNDSFTGGVGLGTWETSAEFKDLSVIADGKTLYTSDFGGKAGDWHAESGDWTATEGVYRQTSAAQDVRSYLDVPSLSNLGDCTIRVKARKLGGAEGFLILFHAKDTGQYLWWNIGGWGNREAGVEASNRSGKFGIDRRVPFTVATGRWYDVRIEAKSSEMQLFIDDKLTQTVRVTGVPTFAVSASRADASGDFILKVVNGAEVDRNSSVQLEGVTDGAFETTVTTLSSESQEDENSFVEPTKVAPKTVPLLVQHRTFNYDFPARSLVILRLHRKT